MKTLVIILSTLIVYRVSAQLEAGQSLHGTFIYLAICKDGIVVASDSKMTLKNDRQEPIYYIDSVRKAYAVNNYVIAFSNTLNLDDNFIWKYCSNLDLVNAKTPIDVLLKYKNILKAQEKDYYTTVVSKESIIFCAGYDWINKKPMIAVMFHDSIISKQASYFTNRNNYTINQKIFDSLSFESTINLITSEITLYKENKDPNYEIGGPMIFYTIYKDKTPKCEQNCDLYQWETRKKIDKDQYTVHELNPKYRHNNNNSSEVFVNQFDHNKFAYSFSPFDYLNFDSRVNHLSIPNSGLIGIAEKTPSILNFEINEDVINIESRNYQDIISPKSNLAFPSQNFNIFPWQPNSQIGFNGDPLSLENGNSLNSFTLPPNFISSSIGTIISSNRSIDEIMYFNSDTMKIESGIYLNTFPGSTNFIFPNQDIIGLSWPLNHNRGSLNLLDIPTLIKND